MIVIFPKKLNIMQQQIRSEKIIVQTVGSIMQFFHQKNEIQVLYAKFTHI